MYISLFMYYHVLNFTFESGNAVLTLKSNDGVKVVTIRPTSFPAALMGDAVAPSEASTQTVNSSPNSEFIGQELTKSDRPELSSAKIVVSGGRGLKSGLQDNLNKLRLQ